MATLRRVLSIAQARVVPIEFAATLAVPDSFEQPLTWALDVRTDVHRMKSHSIPPRSSMAHLCWVLAVSLLSLCAAGNALAYKVERVCEMTEATSKKPATKVCKTLLVKAGPAQSKEDQKEVPKAEKPAAAAHH